MRNKKRSSNRRSKGKSSGPVAAAARQRALLYWPYHRIPQRAPSFYTQYRLAIRSTDFGPRSSPRLPSPSSSGRVRWAKARKAEKTIELPGTEQRIRAKTAWNADTLRGDFADVLILDEWQLMNEDTWETVGAPMLMDNNGDAVFIYTPPSLHSRSAQKARDPRHAAKMFKAAAQDPRWLTVHFTSHDNPHVSEAGIAEVSTDMTQLAIRQEIMAEDVDEVPGALWTLALFDRTRVAAVPAEALPFSRRCGLDPSGSSTNEAGIVAAAKGKNGHGYLLSDKSLLAPTPRSWGQEAVWLYHDLKADRLVGERNYGGDNIRQLISDIDGNVSYRDVYATRGKLVRAEPICALYEKGLLHNVGVFANFEEECCSYVPGISKVSPNRMDAGVWAFTELFPESLRLGLVELLTEAQDKQAVPKARNIAKVNVVYDTGALPAMRLARAQFRSDAG